MRYNCCPDDVYPCLRYAQDSVCETCRVFAVREERERDRIVVRLSLSLRQTDMQAGRLAQGDVQEPEPVLSPQNDGTGLGGFCFDEKTTETLCCRRCACAVVLSCRCCLRRQKERQTRRLIEERTLRSRRHLWSSTDGCRRDDEARALPAGETRCRRAFFVQQRACHFLTITRRAAACSSSLAACVCGTSASVSD